MKKAFLVLPFIIMALFGASCSTDTEYIEVEKIIKDTVYVNNVKHDTIYVDKIVKDTIINNIHDTVYVDRIVKDTIYINGSANIPIEFKSWLNNNKNQYNAWLSDVVNIHEYYNDKTGLISKYKVDYAYIFYGTTPYSFGEKQRGTKMLTVIGVTGNKISLVHTYNITNNTKISGLSIIYPPALNDGRIQFNIDFFPSSIYIGQNK